MEMTVETRELEEYLLQKLILTFVQIIKKHESFKYMLLMCCTYSTDCDVTTLIKHGIFHSHKSIFSM